jgi:cytochrome c oxidase subunit 2
VTPRTTAVRRHGDEGPGAKTCFRNRLSRRIVGSWARGTALAAAAVSLTACMRGPMSYLDTTGAAVDPITRLGLGLIAVSLVVCGIVGTLLLVAIFRRRPPLQRDEAGRLPVGRGGSGLPWVYAGAGISTVILFGSVVWTIAVLAAVMHPPSRPALTLQVTGHQWWWEVRYVGTEPSRTFTTANEIHIPVGQPVRLELISQDVIHSFWVPKLIGKMDLIPGQTNETWIEADVPGSYRGQCGELCGLEHARMATFVKAESPAEFMAWWDAQLTAPTVPAASDASPGLVVFQARCAVCHTVRGTNSGGRLGPDLSHLMQRGTIAAGMLTNSAVHLQEWVKDPQAIKPGSMMPQLDLTFDDLSTVVAYLQTLK